MKEKLRCANPRCNKDMAQFMINETWYAGMYGIPACSKKCAKESIKKPGSVWIGG